MGLRQHFRVRPWTDLVEVFWHRRSQAYVTPVGPEEVCVALIGSAEKAPRTDMAALFPQLAERLARAEPMGSPRGAISISTKLGAVTRGRIALIGDASGSVDAVTGDGLALAFHQATSLGAALAAGDLSSYEISHRRIDRLPSDGTASLLMDGSDGSRRLTGGGGTTYYLSRLMAVHVGAPLVSFF
jgi:2-polyprenyl-6-methoxyphenol hydroxylase-like FAD-dependent oxidoreductase